jgi:hypothetical protein
MSALPSDELVAAIRPLLAHQEPEHVGAALADLVSIYIAGHHPELRAEVSTMFFKLVRDLVPVTVEQMIEQGKCGPEWRGERMQ